MKNLPLLLGTLFGTVALVVLLAFVFSRPATPPLVDPAVVSGQDRPFKGPENAKVTVVEFSDFQCPACNSVQPLVQQLLARYPNDVKFIYRHYPLVSIHQNAQLAAEATAAAASFGKFWELHDLLFAEQNVWRDLSQSEFRQKLDEYTGKLAIDKTAFASKMESKEIKDLVAADIADANRVGINGTPTFFVNGQLTPAPQLLTAVESAVTK